MTKIAILSLVFALIVSSNSYCSNKDIAIFRFEGKVIFVSDLNHNMDSIRTFRCFPFNSLLLKNTGLNKSSQKSLTKFNTVESSFNKRLKFLSKSIKLEKLIFFANKQAITIDKSSINILNSKRCIKENFDKWPTYLQEMTRAEIYLRDRFVLGNKVKKESLQNFVNTIFNRTNHEMLILK